MTQVQDNRIQTNRIHGERRHDIDWMRTLAFLILIIYHLGMYYVADWGWHIKSVEQSVWLQNLMVLTNPWRMSLLFFISAMSMSMVLQQGKWSRISLIKVRSQRLLVPLVFSMLVIVPPQLFYELKQFFGFSGSYLTFIVEYLDLGTELAPEKQNPIGLLTWNHLWFLPYLWFYSLALIVLYPALDAFTVCIEKLVLRPWLMLIVVLSVSAVIWFFLAKKFPTTNALTDDWYNHARYFWAFIVGFMLPRLPDVWQRLVDCRRFMTIAALLSYGWLLMDRHGWLNVGEALDSLWWIQLTHGMLVSINHWAWILAVVAYSGKYLRFSNPFIQYANQAILPWYILHQTLIIVFAVWLSALALPALFEAFFILILTLAGCYIGYELIRRQKLSRWLFGLKV